MKGAAPLAGPRRPTHAFLRYTRGTHPVFLDTDVDMTAVTAHRRASLDAGVRYSWVTYTVFAAGRVLSRHPEANAAIGGWPRPAVVRYDGADAKLALDKTVSGHRIVLSGLLRAVDRSPLAEIQAQVDRYREGDPATMSEFAGAFALHRMPAAVGSLAFTLGVRPLARRRSRLGTFSVTSLGPTAVDGVHSYGGTTVTLGLGRVTDRPVARAGQLAIAPVMRLSLSFDHRVIDGAEAADVLTDLREALESFPPPAEAGRPVAPAEVTA